MLSFFEPIVSTAFPQQTNEMNKDHAQVETHTITTNSSIFSKKFNMQDL